MFHPAEAGPDHDRLDGLFEQYRQLKSVDLPNARAVFGEFRAGLERHIVWEEQFAAEQAGQFTWDSLEQGPAVWRVRIGRNAAGSLAEGI